MTVTNASASPSNRSWLAIPNSSPMCSWMPHAESFAAKGQSENQEVSLTVAVAPSTATALFDITQGCRVWATVKAVCESEGMLTSTFPSTPASCAAFSTRSMSPTNDAPFG
ncbi:hypothetical protein BN975_04786 [Mycolicibacterium farcinogenes]|nr:hypothetical protein BN975_04786 [Mycolicibacterium farcinogenes]